MRNHLKQDRGPKKEKPFRGFKDDSEKRRLRRERKEVDEFDKEEEEDDDVSEYLDLSVKRMDQDLDGNSSGNEHFSRISVIKSALEEQETDYLYQDQPVDFSAKRQILNV